MQKLFNPEDEVLDKDNFSKLDNLIVQTGQYSAFLYEQMKVAFRSCTLALMTCPMPSADHCTDKCARLAGG